MAAGEVELDPGRGPRAPQSDQDRLDDRVGEEDLAVGGLVDHAQEMSAQRGQERQSDVVVFQQEYVVGFVVLLGGPLLLQRIGIDRIAARRHLGHQRRQDVRFKGSRRWE